MAPSGYGYIRWFHNWNFPTEMWVKQLEEKKERSRRGEKWWIKTLSALKRLLGSQKAPVLQPTLQLEGSPRPGWSEEVKLKCKNQSEYKQTQPAVKDNMEKRGNRKKRYKWNICDKPGYTSVSLTRGKYYNRIIFKTSNGKKSNSSRGPLTDRVKN